MRKNPTAFKERKKDYQIILDNKIHYIEPETSGKTTETELDNLLDELYVFSQEDNPNKQILKISRAFFNTKLNQTLAKYIQNRNLTIIDFLYHEFIQVRLPYIAMERIRRY